MATKKQQRRRYQRARAHGRGVDAGAADDSVTVEKGRSSRDRRGDRRPVREPQPPNPKRAAKRSVLVAALFYILIAYTPLFGGQKASPIANLLFSVWTFGMFFVVTMFTERWAWNRYLKQQGKL
jgi:hypothetical protein